MTQKAAVTVAHGDGIGPEIMAAVLHILDAAGARIETETIEIGEAVYLRGNTAGIEPQSWESLRRTKVFLKAPITTPQGGGFKSLNVTSRKTLGLYANVRPCISYYPYVQTKHPDMNVVIVRENEEDTYAGIEHRQTADVRQCLKIITRPGCERIVRYAFEYAKRNSRKKVTCFSKDNIMKMTDGLFHQVFDEIAPEYPDIESEHWIVDIGAAKMADTPEVFDVIVMPNLYGDILSDIAAQIAGSVGLAGSANIGDGAAMFEAIHGSAPRRAGQNLANPSGLLHGAIMMLVHLEQSDIAELVHNAWLRTVEDGIHTYDIFSKEHSSQQVGTKEFGDAVGERIGQHPKKLPAVTYSAASAAPVVSRQLSDRSIVNKQLAGLDMFVDWKEGSPEELANLVQQVNGEGLVLEMIDSRGVKVWPDGFPETKLGDHWRCRFVPEESGQTITHLQIASLLSRAAGVGIDFIKTENLCTFDGESGFSLSQGE
jgi:isocitrate dehydrogenase